MERVFRLVFETQGLPGHTLRHTQVLGVTHAGPAGGRQAVQINDLGFQTYLSDSTAKEVTVGPLSGLALKARGSARDADSDSQPRIVVVGLPSTFAVFSYAHGD